MNDSIFNDLNLDKLNIKDLTLLLEILNEVEPSSTPPIEEEIEVI